MKKFLLCFLIFVSCFLTACGNHAPKKINHLAPSPTLKPQITEVRGAITETRAAISIGSTKTNSAKTRVETIIQTVEKIEKVVDPATAAQLQEVQNELFKVNVDLRDTQQALVVAEQKAEKAEEKTIETEKKSEEVEKWGIDQQVTAEKNADGWRTEEENHKKDVVKKDTVIAKITKENHKLKGIDCVVLGALGAALGWMFAGIIPWPYKLLAPAIVGAGAAIIGWFVL